MKNKTVLVIGAAGFVGPYLVDNLRKHKYVVIPSKLESQKTKDKSFINLDILNKAEILNVLKKYNPRYIVNLAAQANVGYSWKNPILTFNINVTGTLNLLESIKNLNLKTRTLLIGTADEYGKQTKMPVKETAICKPNNFYALSKITQENIGKIYVDNFGLDILFTRSFNHVGPGQALGFVVPDFCAQVVNIEKGLKEPKLYVGNLEAKRDFSNVNDVVDAYRLLLEKGKTGEIYNVGSGKSTSIKEILNIILSNSKIKIRIVQSDEKLRKCDTKLFKADISKIKRDVGYNPPHGIEMQILDVLSYYRHKK